MNILESYTHNLRFKIDSDAPKKYITMWKKIKQECEDGNNECIVEEIKQKCKIESNKQLSYLKRCEGGLCGDSNINNKQIRFQCGILLNALNIHNDILLNVVNSETEKWTYSELDDIICAFIKVLNNKMKTNCVNGYIELIKININDCIYDSNSEVDSDSD